jgi:thioredoxin reductase (NADPH)
MLTTEVENFPGFRDGIMGPALMTEMRAQACRFGTDVRTERVSRVDLSTAPYGVWVGDPDAPEPTYRARSIIVSTGARALMLGLPNEERLVGHGVSTCATCDGFFFRDKAIAVVGGGDSALEEAIFLTKFASSVTIVHRRDELRASKIMQQRAFDNPKLTVRWNAVVDDAVGDSKLEALVLRDVTTGETETVPFDGLFVAIGHVPSTDLFKGQLEMDDLGYLLTHDGTRTNVTGVFAAGDVADHVYRQAITAAGTGCMAAIDAERWLAATDHGTNPDATPW